MWSYVTTMVVVCSVVRMPGNFADVAHKMVLVFLLAGVPYGLK